MSRKSPAEFSELFDRSPTPKSPAELDQRILEYARRKAPQPPRVRQPLFLTAAATLSVACIGLMVVLRSGDPTVPVNRPQQAPLAKPAADSQNTQAISNGATQQSNEFLAKISRAVPKHGVSEQPLANPKQTRTDAKPADLAVAQPMARAQSPAQEFSSPMRKQTPSVPEASIYDEAETTVLDDAPGMPAPQSLEQATVRAALLAGDEKPEASAKHTKIQINNEDMRESLQAIRKLHADGKKSEAEQAYRKLRERCEECDLPESLNRALETMDDGFKE